jgi:hypothetical protein
MQASAAIEAGKLGRIVMFLIWTWHDMAPNNGTILDINLHHQIQIKNFMLNMFHMFPNIVIIIQARLNHAS